MIKLINHIRICFCKHNWELMDKSIMLNAWTNERKGTKWTYRCKKCGGFYTYKNYN